MSLSQLEFIRHIIDECEFIIRVTESKSQEEITSDPLLSRGLIRSLEIIGEASKRIDETFKAKFPQIDWREMAKMRDKLIHYYFGVDYDIVYETVRKNIPELYFELQKIIDL